MPHRCLPALDGVLPEHAVRGLVTAVYDTGGSFDLTTIGVILRGVIADEDNVQRWAGTVLTVGVITMLKVTKDTGNKGSVFDATRVNEDDSIANANRLWTCLHVFSPPFRAYSSC